MKSYAFLALLGAMLTTSCASDDFDEQAAPPLLLDSAGLLSAETRAWFDSLDVPAGYCLVARTTPDSLAPALAGVAADEALLRDTAALDLDEFFQARAIYLYVSQSPRLVQARTGEDLKMLAQWKGATAGPDYLRAQKLADSLGLDSAFRALATHLLRAVPAANDLSAWERVNFNQAIQILGDELAEFSLPSESFYSSALLKPALGLRWWEFRTFGTWWMTYAAIGLLVYLANLLLDKLLDFAFQAVVDSPFYRLGKAALLMVVGLFLALPAVTSAVLLSGARLEDMLALRSAGISLAEAMALPASSFNQPAGWAFVVAMGALRLFKGVAENHNLYLFARLPNENQQAAYERLLKDNPFVAQVLAQSATRGDNFEEILSDETFREAPYYHAYWGQFYKEASKAGLWMGLAWALLPAAVVLAAIFLWLMPVAAGYWHHWQAFRTFNARLHEPQRVPYDILWKFPLAIVAMLALMGLAHQHGAYLLHLLFLPFALGLWLAFGLETLGLALPTVALWGVASLPLLAVIGLLWRQNERYDDEGFLLILKLFPLASLAAMILAAALFWFSLAAPLRGLAHRLIPAPGVELAQEASADFPAERWLRVEARTLNLRADSTTQAPILAALAQGDSLRLVRQGLRWHRVVYQQDTGFVAARFVLLLPENDSLP